jgi:hypothetical protein
MWDLYPDDWLALRSGCPVFPEENSFANMRDGYERRSGNYGEEMIALLIP